MHRLDPKNKTKQETCEMTKKPFHWPCSLAVGLIAASVSFGHLAIAQPNSRPLKIVVPTSPGSSADIGARIVGDQIQKTLGRPVIVENKAGAGGSLSAAAVAAAEPNGDTIGVLGNSYLLFPLEFPQQKFDPIRDVVPVAILSRGANVLLVSSASSYLTLQDLVRRARTEPNKVSYASAGIGSSTHHSAERMLAAAKLDLLHIPYKGSPEAVQEVISGRVDFVFTPVSVAMPFVQSGRVRVLAVSASKRSALLPDTPTTVEAGLPGSGYDTWLVALVPAKTPRAIQVDLNKIFNAALEAPEVLQRFATLGVEPGQMSLEDVQSFISQEHTKALAEEKAKETKNR
jgi:tripartite-type tricarboxylate transporter receptor subunit TctC